MKSFVINLDRRPDKWQQVHRMLVRQGLTPTRFAALSGAEGRLQLPSAAVDGGDLGLIASLLEVLELVSNEEDEWVLVFEDDAKFTRAFSVQRLERVLRSAPAEVVLVQFGYLTGTEWRRELGPMANLHRFLRPRARLAAAKTYRPGISLETGSRFRAGSHALAIRPSGAKSIAAALAPHDEPLDHLLHRAMRRQPASFRRTTKRLATQRGVQSDIAPTRALRRSGETA